MPVVKICNFLCPHVSKGFNWLKYHILLVLYLQKFTQFTENVSVLQNKIFVAFILFGL